jgi:hypothetical protein
MERTHPWAEFLNARFFAILWMKEKFGYDDKRIASDLSMDEMQVHLIRTNRLMPLPPHPDSPFYKETQ